MRTFSAKKETVQRDWYVVDAAGQTLGRLASEIAKRLRGKHKAQYTPHVDTGDYIVVINAKDIKVTGKKLIDKIYYRHSGYTGGMKEIRLEEELAKHPERVLRTAVEGMMPHNPLARDMLEKLRIFSGPEHVHAAQQPVVIKLLKDKD
jgi:large subunit ribosomal protein L13